MKKKGRNEWRGAAAIEIPILPISGVFLFVGSREEFVAYAEGKKGSHIRRFAAQERLRTDSDRLRGLTMTDGSYSLIRLEHLDPHDYRSVMVLYHEALHVALTHMRRLGVEIGEDGEMLAYLQEYIASNLMETLRRNIEMASKTKNG